MNLYGLSSNISKFRIGGLASGLDTDQMISDLMKVERLPLDRLVQKKQIAEWKRDDYRSITNLLRGIKDEFFDIIKPSSYSLSRAYYKKFQAVSSDSAVVSASAGVDAVPGTHTITVNNVATASAISSSASVAKQLEGKQLSSIDINLAKGKSFTFVVDGISKTITISNSIGSTQDLVSNLQGSIDAAFGSGKVTVTDTVGDGTGLLTFVPQQGSGVSKLSLYSGPNESSDAFNILGFTSSSNLSNRLVMGDTLEKLSTKLRTPFSFDSQGKVNLTINGRQFKFEKTTTLSSMMNTINSDAAAGVNMQYNDITDTFTFTAKQTGEGNHLNISETGSSLMAALGFKSQTGSAPATFNLTKTKMNVNIDGVTREIVLSSDLTSYDELAADIKTKIGEAFDGIQVNVSVDASNRLNIALQPGSGNTLSIGAPDNSEESALSELGLSSNYITGRDASLILDGNYITRSSNSFTVGGITYNVLKESPLKVGGTPGERTPLTISTSLNVDNIYDNIKKFVDKYNEVIDKINGKLSEKYDRAYQPLTNEQKESMSEGEVKKWEEKAKTGLLRNDSLLQNIVYGMRRALTDSISGVSINLSSIGITTGDYSEKGRLKIDEAKLKAAIANNPEEVANLFSKDSGIDLSAQMSTAQRQSRYNNEGLAHRLFDIVEDNIRTVGGKGFLLQKAGIAGDRTEFENTLFEEIDAYEDEMVELSRKLYSKETKYYNKFAAMEKMLAQMNSQSNWLMSQFNQGG